MNAPLFNSPDIAMALVSTGVYLVISYYIGSLILKNTCFRCSFPVKTVLGMDILTVIVFLLGWSGLISRLNIRFIFFMVFFALMCSGLATYFSKQRKSFLKAYRFLPILLILLPGLLILGRSLASPTSWDELTYQLTVPAKWIQNGRICFIPDIPYSGFPSAASINFYLMLILGGTAAPRIFILSLWGLSMLSLQSLLKPGLTRPASVILTLSFGICSAVLISAGSAYVELFILANFAAILLTARQNFMKTPTLLMLILTGFFAGIAASVKLTGLIIGASLILFMQLKNAKPAVFLKIILVFTATFIIISSAFYIRPYLETGNPMYPYFQNFFSDNPASLEMSRYHHAIGSLKYGTDGIYGFFSAPILLCFSSNLFDGSFGWQFSFILLLSVVSLLMAMKNDSLHLKPYFLLVLILYSFWFFSSQQSRFLIPALFLMVFLSKFSLKYIPMQPRIVILASIIILSIFSVPLNIVKDCIYSWKSVLGSMKQEDYLYSSTGPGYLQAVQIVNTKLPKDARLMMIFENRGFYFKRNAVIATPFFQEKFFTPPEQTVDKSQIMKVLRENKITHVLVGLSENDPDRLPQYLERTRNFAESIGSLSSDGNLRKIWDYEYFQIYEVKKDQH